MMKDTEPFAYMVSEGALVKIAETAALHVHGVAGTKGRGILVKNTNGSITIDIHIQAYYGVPLRTLALTVQQQTAQAVRIMADPKELFVHVTIEDLLIKPNCKNEDIGG